MPIPLVLTHEYLLSVGVNDGALARFSGRFPDGLTVTRPTEESGDDLEWTARTVLATHVIVDFLAAAALARAEYLQSDSAHRAEYQIRVAPALDTYAAAQWALTDRGLPDYQERAAAGATYRAARDAASTAFYTARDAARATYLEKIVTALLEFLAR